MDKASVINVDNIQTVVKEKIGTFMTRLSDERMLEVFEAIKFAFGFEE